MSRAGRLRTFHVGLALCLLVLSPCAGRGDDVTATLARELALEGEYAAAAIEYRRLALEENDAKRRAGYYWTAAYQYHRAGNGELAAGMLDRAEDDSDELTTESLLLRGELALDAGLPDRAEFYLAAAARQRTNTASYQFAARRLARARLLDGNLDAAKKALAAAGRRKDLATVNAYGKGRGRIPAVGGILGLVPGLGHVYSGEYLNAFRSLLLNAIFIYAMVDTADDEEWGAFAAVTFFELTWYTGSIYGGIDAAHRYNRNRLNDCLREFDGQTRLELDLSRVPVVSLKFTF